MAAPSALQAEIARPKQFEMAKDSQDDSLPSSICA
jgi:hypothetical protein